MILGEKMKKKQLYLAKVLLDLDLDIDTIVAITSLSKLELFHGLVKNDETR